MNKRVTGAMLAVAVAALFASGKAMSAGDKAATPAKGVKCAGVNSCKGKGSCSGKDNSCAGKNGCKGKGWVTVGSEKDCTAKGGTVVKDK